MYLQPKRTKFKKHRKGKLTRFEYKTNKLQFGIIGLKAMESGSISSKQIEAARQAITRKIKRNGRVWIRIFPDISVTSKPIAVRMGKGKGSVDHWIAKVASGRILFEIDGLPPKLAKAALYTGGAKLPVKTSIIL
jgi:large subunit ribosomal protein L16